MKELQKTNGLLERKAIWLKSLIRNSTGQNAELYIVELLNGMPSTKNDGHDVTVRGGKRLEVKGADINIFRNKGSINDGRRWTWHNFLGVGGAKTYDNLILVGEIDKNYIKDYKDKKSEFVIFDIPFEWAKDFASRKKTKIFTLHLQTKITGSRGIHLREIWQFEVTREALISKYKVK